MKDKGSDIKRILLCRLGGIGDVILTLPLVKYLRNKYREASIEYITSENLARLLVSSCPFIDHVWIYNTNEQRQLAKDVLSKQGKIDYFFNLHHSPKFFLFNLLYIRSKRFFQYKKNIALHAAVNFARTYDLSLTDSDLDSRTLFVDGSKDVLNTCGLEGKRYICFVVGVGKVRPHRAWPIDKWIGLTKAFLVACERDFKVVYLGGCDEESLKTCLLAQNGETVNLIGELSLLQTAKVISKSACLISCDTGLLHLACALGVDVVGLYGPTLTTRCGPFTKSNSQVLVAKDCKCIGRFKDSKSCVRSQGLSGYCMNNLAISDVLDKLLKFSFQPSATR